MINKPGDDLARVWAAPVVALLLGALVLFAPQVLNDGDTYWHLATGRWILEHGQVPAVDVFSYSRPGIPWVAHEWLSDLLMALAWRGGGWSGLLALFALSMGAAGWLITRRLSQSIGGVTLAVTAVLAFACMGGSLLARPQLFMLPVLIVWVSELMTAREQRRAPKIAFALLMTLWANLHGSYVFGFLLAAAFGLEALVEQKDNRLKVIRDWGLFGAASLACALITPHGLAGVIYPFQIMTLTILPNIVEWRAADFAQLTPFEMALLATIFVCLWRGVKVPPVRLLLLLLLLHMSLQHGRHQLVLAAVAPLLLAAPLARALEHVATRPRLERRSAFAFAVAAVLLVGVRLAIPVVRVDGVNSPVTALSKVPADLVNQPVLNGYGFGGYLIFQGKKPFIDGRSDMYGNAFSAAYFRATEPNQAALDKIVHDYGVAWTIFAPDDPTVRALDADPKWRRIYTDNHAVVHRRAPPGPAAD